MCPQLELQLRPRKGKPIVQLMIGVRMVLQVLPSAISPGLKEWVPGRNLHAKKKDEFTYEYKYRWTNWPICERWKAEPGYAQCCSIMSQQSFGCDFDWDMAVEADRLGLRHEQQERKGKGSGKYGQQTFIV